MKKNNHPDVLASPAYNINPLFTDGMSPQLLAQIKQQREQLILQNKAINLLVRNGAVGASSEGITTDGYGGGGDGGGGRG